MTMEKKFNQVYTLARVSGDAYTVAGKNGKTYTLVPITMMNGWRARAFCNVTPEQDSLVLVRAVARDNGFSYELFVPNEKVKDFLKSASADVQ